MGDLDPRLQSSDPPEAACVVDLFWAEVTAPNRHANTKLKVKLVRPGSRTGKTPSRNGENSISLWISIGHNARHGSPESRDWLDGLL